MGGSVPLGVLPVGTLNHFARDLGIPVELPEAVRVIAGGAPRALDVGEVNGKIFINNSMLGLYPPMVGVRDRERREKNRGKWLATFSALLKVLPRHPLLHIRVTAEGLTADHQTRFVFVGNNEYEMSAFTYGARSRFDSGNLYLYIAKSRTRLGLVGLGLLGLFRDVKWTDRFERLILPEFTIETHKKAAPVYLDGEVVILQTPLVYRNRAHALQVILPREGVDTDEHRRTRTKRTQGQAAPSSCWSVPVRDAARRVGRVESQELGELVAGEPGVDRLLVHLGDAFQGDADVRIVGLVAPLL